MDTLSSTIQALIVLGIIAAVVVILAALYSIAAFRRMAIAYKKIDYLIEDLTYKSEILNSTVETVSKMSNYLDAFEVVARQNVKSGIKIIARNKDMFYGLAKRVQDLALTETSKSKKPKKAGKK